MIVALAAALALAGSALDVTCERGVPHASRIDVRPPQRGSYLTDDGAIRLVGYNDMATMVERWNRGFAALHPGFRFATDLRSTRSGPPALIAGTAAAAPMGAPFTTDDLGRYQQAVGGSPLALTVAHASLSPKALSGPLAIIVPESSPMRSVRWSDLPHIFSDGSVSRWRELGVEGPMAEQPIHPIGLGPGAALRIFFESVALSGSPLSSSVSGFRRSSDVIEAIAHDPLAIGFAAANLVGPGLRILPIDLGGGRLVLPTRDSLRSGAYPLDRKLLVYVRAAVEPWLAEYLRYLLSCEGQAIVASDPVEYIPLTAREARRERAKLR